MAEPAKDQPAKGAEDAAVPTPELPPLDELGVDLSESAVPVAGDQFIQQYINGRDAFIEREGSTRSDAAFRSTLHPRATEACLIVARIRAHEYTTLWAADTDAETETQTYPGMPFLLAKARMESSELWRIVRRMPKGCLLHTHFDAMFDARALITDCLKLSGMGIRSSRPLSDSDALDSADVRFKFCGGELALATADADAAAIFSTSYASNSWVSAQAAARAFVPTTKYPDFITWLVHRCTIQPEDALSATTGSDAIWCKFISCDGVVSSMLTYEPLLRAALQRLFRELMADGIRWAEFRYCFVNAFYRDGSSTPEGDYVRYLIVFDEELGKFQNSPEGQSFWGARFIWTSIRSFSAAAIRENMAQCIRHKAMFPHLIAAYDLVGQEDPGATLLELLPEIFWFKKACAAAGLNIPFVFHAGETIESGSACAQNMHDAVLLGTRRLGHAYALYKHPLLLESVKSKHIAVESCPLSNEVLRLTGSVMQHPLPALLARGVKCTISNDDPAILGGPGGPGAESRNGTSRDMWSILQGWEDLGLAGLGSLAEESVRFALFEVPDTVDEDNRAWLDGVKKGPNGTGVRAVRMREWRQEWEEFIEWVLAEYEAKWGGEQQKS